MYPTSISPDALEPGQAFMGVVMAGRTKSFPPCKATSPVPRSILGSLQKFLMRHGLEIS